MTIPKLNAATARTFFAIVPGEKKAFEKRRRAPDNYEVENNKPNPDGANKGAFPT